MKRQAGSKTHTKPHPVHTTPDPCCRSDFSPIYLSGDFTLSTAHSLINQKYLWKVAFTCFLPVLPLQDSDILSLGVSSHRSWWKDNGPGCDSEGLPTAGWQNQQNPQLTNVLSCWLEYQYIEILHCIVQLLLSVSLCDCHALLTHSSYSFCVI